MTVTNTFLSTSLSNEEYHGYPGTLSSSNLKLAVEDIEVFYKSCITKELEKEHIPAFDTGTYFHTRVLEPHKLEEDCAVWEGVRRGKAWEEFQKANKGKAILIKSQQETAENLAKLVFDSPMAMDLINRGEPEVSAFAGIIVDWQNGKIYSEDLMMELTIDGWKTLDFDDEVQLGDQHIVLVLKVRADCLIKEDKAILDLKSTTGSAKNVFGTRKKISMYEYDLSASMYLDIFSLATGDSYDKFYWTFASKDKNNCKTYLASEANVKVGRAKWMKAVLTIAQFQAGGWQFYDEIDLIEPEPYQVVEWLGNKETK